MSTLKMEILETREAPVSFDIVFALDSWFTPQRRGIIASAVNQWSFYAEPLPAIPQTDYAVYDFHGAVIDPKPSPLPADTLRVYVGVGSVLSHRDGIAESGPAPISASAIHLPRNPGGVMTFDPSRVRDESLTEIALHETGHVIGLPHQSPDTPPERRSVMYPYLSLPPKTALTGREARDLVQFGQRIAPGTFIVGIGTTPGGWMISPG